MKVAFVFAPYHHKLFAENLRVVDEDFGRFPPINLAYAAAITENAGHEIRIIDANALNLTIEETIERLKRFTPDIIGYYFSTYMFHDTLRWAREIKERIPVPVLAGGINIGLYPKESMTHETIDYGVIGEANSSLPALLDAIEKRSGFESLDGICYRDGDKVVVRYPQKGFADFNSYPFPARHHLPNEKYYSITSQRRNFTIMMTAMGCAHQCSYCAIAPIPYRCRDVESVLAEVDECYEDYGVREIDFFDADFPFLERRAIGICEGLLERQYDLEWSCRARIDSVNPKLLDLMSRSGCKRVYFGIETPNEKTLREIKKHLDASKIKQTIADAQAVGIRPLGFFMTGLPGETYSSVLRTVRFALGLKLDYAQFSRTIAKPCTELDKNSIEESGHDYWRDYILGKENERRLGSPWTDLSEAEIEMLTKCAYYVFYYRPSFVLGSLAKVRSFDEFKRSVRTAFRMALSVIRKDH